MFKPDHKLGRPGQFMTRNLKITFDGQSFDAKRGQLLLDAAIKSGVDLPFDCRSGHCGTCCVRLLSGKVEGGQAVEPGIVHTCQCRAISDAVIERVQPTGIATVNGTVSSLRAVSHDVLEVGIKTERALPHHAGQYAQLRFAGYPSRPFSFSHSLESGQNSRGAWFHVRRMDGGLVTSSLGRRIKRGHLVELTGPFGSAHFRPNLPSRLILVATNTGFAPVWAIAVAALREDPYRPMTIIAGARSLHSLYMAPALVQLASFRNVEVVVVCSAPQSYAPPVIFGRPTDVLPPLIQSDVIYACGAPAMVDAIKARAAQAGAICYADPFFPSADGRSKTGVLDRARGWISAFGKRPERQGHARGRRVARDRSTRTFLTSEAEVDRHSPFHRT